MSTVSKYWEKYRNRHRNENADPQKQMTDRQNYISFLEVQLDRVNQSVLLSQGYNERIEQIQTQMNTIEDRLLNVTRLVKLQQNYAESQEEEFQTFRNALGKDAQSDILRRMSSLEKRMEDLSSGQKSARRGKKSEPKWESEEKIYEVLNRNQRRAEENMERVERRLERAIDEKVNGLQNSIDNCIQECKYLQAKISERPKIKREDGTPDPHFDKRLSDLGVRVTQVSTDITHALSLIAEANDKIEVISNTNDDRYNQCDDQIAKLEEIVLKAIDAPQTQAAEALTGVSFTDLEQKIGKKVTDSITRMGELLKSYGDAQRTLNNEVKDLTRRTNRLEGKVEDLEDLEFEQRDVPTNISIPHRSQDTRDVTISPSFGEAPTSFDSTVKSADQKKLSRTPHKSTRGRSPHKKRKTKSLTPTPSKRHSSRSNSLSTRKSRARDKHNHEKLKTQQEKPPRSARKQPPQSKLRKERRSRLDQIYSKLRQK